MSARPVPLGDPARVRVVPIGEYRVSSTPGEILITYALGSCLAVCIHDPVAGVGGLLHAMLPESDRGGPGGRLPGSRYIDIGVPLLFRECYDLGARKERLVVKVAGGASVAHRAAEDHFRIGERNIASLETLLRRNDVAIAAADLGGEVSRTVSLEIGTGVVTVKANGDEYEL